MKSWEKFSGIISRILVWRYFRKYRSFSIEKVLKQSLTLLGDEAIEELKKYIISRQVSNGAFADRAGNGDLYYTLFGCFLAEALGTEKLMTPLRQYVQQVVHEDDLEGVYVYSAAILCAKTMGIDAVPAEVREKIMTGISGRDVAMTYAAFMTLLAFYYTKENKGLIFLMRYIEKIQRDDEVPCPVAAARLLLQHSLDKPTEDMERYLFSLYRNDGSFAASKDAPAGDLLSTAVALYALAFAGSDLRLIKPACLDYVDSLYSEGGFCASAADYLPDVEYTFYGLLALGALYKAS